MFRTLSKLQIRAKEFPKNSLVLLNECLCIIVPEEAQSAIFTGLSGGEISLIKEKHIKSDDLHLQQRDLLYIKWMKRVWNFQEGNAFIDFSVYNNTGEKEYSLQISYNGDQFSIRKIEEYEVQNSSQQNISELFSTLRMMRKAPNCSLRPLSITTHNDHPQR